MDSKENLPSLVSAIAFIHPKRLADPLLYVRLCTVCVLSCFSHVQLFVTPWTVAWKVLLSMGFSRQKYWSGLPCFPQGDLPNPGIKPISLMSPALTGAFSTTRATWEAYIYFGICPQFLAQSSYNPWNFLSNRECIGLA